MDNADIAKVFDEIADMLEIKGADRFRIRSYRRAAATIEGLAEGLSRLYSDEPGGLKKIPGIGEGLGRKIVELIETGRCAYHDELVRDTPAGIFDILKVRGIGPKKAAHIYRDLGVSGIAELEEAARGHRLCALAGFGERSEQKILSAIHDFRTLGARHTLAAARAQAAVLCQAVSELPAALEVLPAGSLRRWRDSIGDIDILVAAPEGDETVMDAFVALPGVAEVVSRGHTRASVVLACGMQADLRVVEEDSFGAALQYFTGSRAHSVALRERAVKMGLRISEYGVFRVEDGSKVAGADEEGVYESVGLAWIPPELREAAGEIEAAEEGRLPELVALEQIRGDLHMHTSASDGACSVEEMAGTAMDLGYEYIAVTDHSRAVGIAHGLDARRLLAQGREIDALNRALCERGEKFRVLKGAEVDIMADGTLDYPPEVTDTLDLVVGSVHSGFEMDEERMTQRIIRGIRSGRIDILAHPTGRLIGVRQPYRVDMEAVLDAAAECGVAMELNSCPQRLDLSGVHCRMAQARGLKVAISTDAHSPAQLSNMAYGIHTAGRGWLEALDVLNTMDAAGLMEHLKGRRRGGRTAGRA